MNLPPKLTLRRATVSFSPKLRMRGLRSRRPISATSSIITARKRRALSLSISDSRYLYYVLPNRKAIRYGVTVGEDALAFWGVARVGRKEEWPAWVPTADIKRRIPEVPNRVEGGAHNPLGARGIYLYQGNRDTLFRIHGTNQPEYIGHAISSGCIRMTNEDVIDLYNRVKMGAIVVVLAPGLGRPRMAMTSNPN